MSAGLDARFTSLPLDALTDAALSRARQLGATHADVRIERVRNGMRLLRDGALESSSDSTDLGIGVRVVHDGAWGFAAGITLTTDGAAALADQAVAAAKISRVLSARPVELADEPGHVGEWVSQEARSWPADLIVVGTLGRRGVERLVMGSGAEYIARNAPVPVLLVRSPDAPDA